MDAQTNNTKLDEIRNAVLVKSMNLEGTSDKVTGYDFNKGPNFDALLESYKYMGFQATSVGKAIDEINKMIRWRLSHEPIGEDEAEEYQKPAVREATRCTIFLGYTSNLISSGLREIIRYLVQNRMVDCIVTTAGGVEEDLIKCMAPSYHGEFSMPGAQLRAQGLNRIGNILVPNDNYCKFEEWLMPVLTKMLEEQKTKGKIWSPSKMIRRFGKEINNPDSVYYWAYKNKIPVFCPAITDGSIGDMIYVHSFKHPGLIVDIAQDIRKINTIAVWANRTGVIILGGGVIKHHICNANLMRNGAEYAVYVNTGQEFDGSDSGARPDEAVSWGKIKADATPVKIYAEATIVFPLLVGMTFAKHWVAKPPLPEKKKKH